jgi:hypothetical protein
MDGGGGGNEDLWVLDRVFPILVCFGDYVLNIGI